ncbi:DNA-binding CsgD family transcriptional regulator [Streptomyces sp. SAI-126]|uniref:AAA family ATPase n=1 Tax=Streptomyces sp. SAI-126 TaxID=3377732 RepID=UPI003C7E234E
MRAASLVWSTGGGMDESAIRDRAAPIGREEPCRVLDGMVDGLSERGGAVLLSGDPGIGKSTLLDHVAGRAGVRVVRARGVESETVLPYSVLADVLLPLRERFADVPSAQRRALEKCLALSEATGAGPYAVCAGALGVLAAAGEREPLVVLVDDLHWADADSRRVLLFVARRLATERLALVMAARTEHDAAVGWEGVHHLPIPALGEQACRELLRRRDLDPAAPAVDRLLRLSSGNPLVLLEYADRLARARALGRKQPDQEWEIPGPRVERAWWGPMTRLSPAAHEALLYVALSRCSTAALVDRALRTAGLPADALAPAEEAGLVRSGPEGYALRHPVLRPLVLGHSSAAQRLRTYRVLADVSSGELRTWYRAAATAAPDEAVAAALATEAARTRQRGELDSSARAWHRAAELSPEPADRSARLFNAAQDAFLGGATGDAAHWAEQALRWSDTPELTADIELLRGQARSWLGDPAAAHRLLVSAAAAVEPADPARACTLYAAAAMPAAMAGRIDAAAECAARCGGLADALDPGVERRLAAAMEGNMAALTGDVERSRDLLRRAGAELPGAGGVEEQQLTVLIGQAHSWVDEDERARVAVDGVVDWARRYGVPALLPFALVARGEMESSGHWAAARADGAEALRWGREFGHRAMTGYALTTQARLEGLRGDREQCTRLIAQYDEQCGEGVPGLEAFAQGALGSAALTAGDLDASRSRLERAFAAAADAGLRNPNLMPFVADLAEAHSRAGHRDRVREIADWLEERADSTGLAWPAAAHARCRMMLAESADEAWRWQTAAERAQARRVMTFETARTRLVFGQTLRRLRRPAAAREPLGDARRIFAALGASPWAAMAEAELAAAGHRPGPGSARLPQTELLTAQELQVARVVAEGLSNIEAAAALFLSRKTVEAHLTRIYRKLGLRSRSDLARYLTQTGVVA